MEHKTLSWWASLSYIINSLVGAGFLAVPYVFFHGGWALTLVASLFITILNYIAYTCHIETMARMEAYLQLIETGQHKTSLTDVERYFWKDIGEPLLDREEESNKEIKPEVTDRKLEVSDLCYLTLGKTGEFLYLFGFSLGKYGGLTSAAILWGTGLSSLISVPFISDTCDIYDGEFSCRMLYTFWVTIFAIIVLPMTIMDFREQKWIQIASTGFRLSLVLFMFVSAGLIGLFGSGSNDGDDYPSTQAPEASDMAHFGSLFPILLFATAFQPNIPIIINHLENRQKNATSLYYSAITGNTIFLLIFGFVIAYVFGADISRQANLNWSPYLTSHGILLKVVAGLILLSPCFNGTTTYSLRSIVLAESLASLWGYTVEQRKTKKIQVAFRLVVGIPPILASLLVYNLSDLLAWTGLLFFTTFFILPGVFYLAAKRMIPQKTPYDTWVSANGWTYLLLASSSTGLVYCLNQKLFNS
mmetsp:Transcript_60884/g.69620  ORF Transcript_60884/g.69620 Transcript_60884/m.69620 type:complete len:473 (+) Transcript_60884:54-1472(+)